MRFLGAICLCELGLAFAAGAADFPRFELQEIDPHAGNVCYAATVADVNGDRKPDVVVATEDAVVWYESPSWTKHDLIRQATERDNVCIQAHDIDGDGRIDFALGAGWRPPDTRKPSTLQWLGRDAAGRWQIHPIAFEEPTLHRIRWGDVKGTGKKQLVVAPLQGRGTKGPNWGEGQGVRVLVYDVPEPAVSKSWPVEVADSSLHTIHNLQLIDLDRDGRDEIVLACWEGVFLLDRNPSGTWTKTRLGTGNQDTKPFKGASEVKVGRWHKNLPYVATIEPWHGHQAVVYSPSERTEYPALGLALARGELKRQVVAEPLTWGHAVWCADLDGDGDDELIVGQRDPNRAGSPGPRGPGVFVFDPQPAAIPIRFERHTVDDGGMACEDALAADLDDDGRPEIIACGRATHNVRIYWNHPAAAGHSHSRIDPKINEPFRNPDLEVFTKRFESPDREVFAKRNEIVAALRLRPGMAVADVGAGTGLFTRLIAEKVGPAGKVYAVDIAPTFVEHIAREAKKHGHNHVVTVLSTQDSTGLPEQSVDLVFLSDVYHHLEKPDKVLASIRRALRAGGNLVVIDFDRVEGRSSDFVLKHVRAEKAVIVKEIETAGFSAIPAPEAPQFKENFFLRFRRSDGRPAS